MDAAVSIDVALARALLREQHPDLADLELVEAGRGWDNVVFRLGTDLAIRLPVRQLGADLVAGEVRWLRELSGALPLPIPTPIRVGTPGAGYPWPWTIVSWFEGSLAWNSPLDPVEAADTLGGFVRALGRPAPAGAPENPSRGVPLADRDRRTRERLAAVTDMTRATGSDSNIDFALLIDIWERSLAVPPWRGAPVWLHGDLHPANLVVRSGRIVAVIDFGDLTAGDPATDLSVAWMLFGAEHRARFRVACGEVDDDTWERARGNALAHAVACLTGPPDDARVQSIGARTLQHLTAEASFPVE